jgi:MFS family permease
VLFVAIFGSNLPAPLYERYRVDLGLTTLDVALIFATYPIALVGTLLAFARLPDRIGRKAVLVLAVAISGLGSLAFAIGSHVAWLFVGRFLVGVMAMAVFTVSAIAQVARRNLPDVTAIRVGLSTTVLALAAILAAVPLHALALVVFSAFLAGIGQGAGFLGAQSLVNHVSPPALRAALAARFYAINYLCIGVGVIAIGALTRPLGLFWGFAVVGGLATAIAIVTLAATRDENLGQTREATA